MTDKIPSVSERTIMKTVQVRNITIGEGRPKICVPIVGQTKEDILLEAGTFERIPVDVVEWRVDWFENVFDTDKVLDVAKRSPDRFKGHSDPLYLPYCKGRRRKKQSPAKITKPSTWLLQKAAM